MSRTNDNHKSAEIIKDLEERIANLEERDRSSSTPTLLRKKTDRVVADDSSTTVRPMTIDTFRWGEPGYDISAWGE